MNDKAIQMATKQCPVCGHIHKYNTEVLIHKRLGDITNTFTGKGLCEEHSKLHEDGYIALVVIVNSPTEGTEILKQEDADRTGQIIHMKREAFRDICNTPLDEELPMVFINEDLAEILTKHFQ